MLKFIHELGEWHPAAVHFPIALLLVAALMEFISALRKNDPRFHFAATCNLHLGAISAIVAAALGWADAGTFGAGNVQNPLFLHRWTGTFAALWAVITLGLWARAQRPEASRWLYRFALWLGAVAIGAAGYLGGIITHG